MIIFHNDVMTYALSRWNEIKAAQKKKGHVVAFNNEYDATAESTDFPIHYSYMTRSPRELMMGAP